MIAVALQHWQADSGDGPNGGQGKGSGTHGNPPESVVIPKIEIPTRRDPDVLPPPLSFLFSVSVSFRGVTLSLSLVSPFPCGSISSLLSLPLPLLPSFRSLLSPSSLSLVVFASRRLFDQLLLVRTSHSKRKNKPHMRNNHCHRSPPHKTV